MNTSHSNWYGPTSNAIRTPKIGAIEYKNIESEWYTTANMAKVPYNRKQVKHLYIRIRNHREKYIERAKVPRKKHMKQSNDRTGKT